MNKSVQVTCLYKSAEGEEEETEVVTIRTFVRQPRMEARDLLLRRLFGLG
jgi:hypothetical protein